MTQARENYRIRVADWPVDREKLRTVREAVFVTEQGVPPELEWDRQDADACHLIVENSEGEPLGCARLLNTGRIGRMAVLAPYRGRGIGAELLAQLIRIARRNGLSELHLHAQLGAVGFYRRAGFHSCGPVFEEAGIAHQAMKLSVH